MHYILRLSGSSIIELVALLTSLIGQVPFCALALVSWTLATMTVLMLPSWGLGNTCVIFANGQLPRSFFSRRQTKSPTWIGCDGRVHLFIKCSCGIVSWISLVQKDLVTSCSNFHFVANVCGGDSWVDNPSRFLPTMKWFGVKTNGSSPSVLTWQSGREFIIPSVWVRKVSNCSESIRPGVRIAVSVRFIVPTARSTKELCTGANGAVKCHFISGCFCLTRSGSSLNWWSCKSRCAPTKFVPLSLCTKTGLPRRKQNRSKAIRNEDVSIE